MQTIQKPHSSETSASQDEQAIAQTILKRAEIARITRQLKTKLLKAKNKTESFSSSNNNSSSTSLRSSAQVLPTPPSSQIQIPRKRSRESLNQHDQHASSYNNSAPLIELHDEYETDEYESPTKKSNNNHNNIPSSPLYTIGETLHVPSTPPRKNATLSSSANNNNSSNGNDLLSTPKSKVINNRNLSNFKTPTSTTSHKVLFANKTPNNTSDLTNSSSKKKKFGTPGHAAELLMFFANSPSPAGQPAAQSRKVLPTTPKRLFNTNDSSNIFNSTPPTSAGIAAANALGSTPLSSSHHSRTIDLFGTGSGNKFNPPATPGRKNGNSFVLNDFVTSVFTPSPRR